MGADQSTPRHGGQGAPAAVRKTCYYELLGVERQADDAEIRRAYKTKALELHPDRNLGDTENATRRFAEVQTAYEVISDPQERAWYDSHRDAILNGDSDGVGDSSSPGQPTSGFTPASAVFALMGGFNSSVPMTDAQNGFFGILNAFFGQLAMEETAACEWDSGTPVQYPSFGKAADDYNSVAKPFYNVWSAFSTRKSFSWMDKYRVAEAPDRRIRRLMERENQKFREEGIREFNDAVTSLVAFIKKRDPRYMPNTQSEAERQELLRKSAAEQAARSRAANNEKLAGFSVPEWARSRTTDDHNDEFSQSEEESEVEVIECVVCNKKFKSEKQFQAHERSKKHLKAVDQLRREMTIEDSDLELGEPAGRRNFSPDEASDTEDPNLVSASTVAREGDTTATIEGTPQPQDAGTKAQINQAAPTSDVSEDDEYAPRAEVEGRLVPDRPTGHPRKDTDDARAVDTDSLSLQLDKVDIGNEPQPKIGKAKQKRDKKAARATTNATPETTVRPLHS
jgi:DnaJ family protein A protein 5